MKNKEAELLRLQAETAHKENVLHGLYSGLLGFSGACLLMALGGGANTILEILAVCLFVTATFFYATVVLSRIFVLHKGVSLHIGHVIVAEDNSKPAMIVAGISLVAGLSAYASRASIWVSFFVVMCAVLAFKHHLRFKRNFDAMIDAREMLKENSE